jgi:hypothetical protein
MTVPIGYKVNIIANNIFYLPINKKEISSIYFEITNQDGEVLNLKEEEVVIAVHIKHSNL